MRHRVALPVVVPVLLIVACCLVAAPAHAQTDHGIFTSVGLGAGAIDGSTQMVVSASVGYRLTATFGLGAELTLVPSLSPDVTPFNSSSSTLLVTDVVANQGGHAAVFTTNVRFELPVRSRRVLPYIVGGGGVGLVRESWTETITFSPGPSIPVGIAFPLLLPAPASGTITRNSTDLALTTGGGVSVLTRGRLSIDFDARYLGLLGSRDFHSGRFSVGATYRY